MIIIPFAIADLWETCMPARRSSSHGRPARHDADQQPAADSTADDTVADAEGGAEDVAAEFESEDVPMNRAARRAKGKAAMQPRPVGKILPGRTNQSHGPRSYANRRSG
jgi:hypothetical protein